jgi:Cu(I)/Ag(I) efflux system membrane fusion protein
MKRAVFTSAAVAALIAAAGGGFIAGRAQRQPAETSHMAVVTPAAAQTSGAPIYYQDPDGRPLYSLMPTKTPDGREYRGVPAGADISFEEASAPEATPADRKIKYYRNPMGLPDTSPVPKKDSMGMDYIAVYEGDDTDDGSVKLSPGKIQRTGANRSQPPSG